MRTNATLSTEDKTTTETKVAVILSEAKDLQFRPVAN